MLKFEDGYKCFTGYILSKPEAELLNKMYAERDANPDNEQIANNCHKMFCFIANGKVNRK